MYMCMCMHMCMHMHMCMYVGHDERSGSEPDIRPTNLTGSPYASYRMVGVTGKPKI